MVLTAAHCIPDNVYQLFAYYGDNYPAELAELTPDGGIGLMPPPIGAPSHWAQADSWQINPARDPAKNSADMAVVFLDRKPPFDPLPLYRNRVNSNVQVTITGWGSNSTPTPITGAGYGVQRTGRSVTSARRPRPTTTRRIRTPPCSIRRFASSTSRPTPGPPTRAAASATRAGRSS